MSKTSKNYKIKVKKDKVTSYQKKVKKYQKMSKNINIIKKIYNPKSARISGPRRTVQVHDKGQQKKHMFFIFKVYFNSFKLKL